MFALNDLYTPQNMGDPSISQTSDLSGAPVGGLSELTGNMITFTGSLVALAASGLVLMVIFNLVLNWWLKKKFDQRRIGQWKKSVVLEITVPKESAEEISKSNPNKKDEKEFISVGEQIFLVLQSFAVSNWKRRWEGCERFSFEILNISQEIRFWVVCSQKTSEVLEKQITAHFPKAHIDINKDEPFFKSGSLMYGEELVLHNKDVLPFRTYRNIEADPISTLTNAISKTGKEESLAIQLILIPIKNKWQKKPRLLALKIQQGQNPEQVLNPKTDYSKIFKSFLSELFKLFTLSKKDDTPDGGGKKERQIDITGKYTAIQLTPQQQEIIKKLEEKASRPGFLYSLRVVAGAKDVERAKQMVKSVLPAFGQYTILPFNGLKTKKAEQHTLLENFVWRSPNFGQNQILNTEEVNSIWHLPNHLTETPNIKWLQSKVPPIPLGVPEEGNGNIFLGTSKYRGVNKKIFIKSADRLRHMYCLGGSGSGKSVFLLNLILQDIVMGNGLCIVDPHGELVDDVLYRIPKERAGDVIVFNPAFTDRPMGLNMLETDPGNPVQATLVIDDLFKIFDKLYDLKATGGPIFESYMKNAMRLVMAHPESGCTLMEISKVMADEDFRSFKLAMCDNQEVVDFWEKEAQKAGGDASLENMVPYVTSKLAPFVTNEFVRPIIGQQKSAIDFRKAMDNRQILLISLAKGRIGETSAYLLGMIIIGKILMAGMGRADGMRLGSDGERTKIMPDERPDFFVYVDEMQNFLFDSIPKALEEIRKYHVGFALAHQFVKQIIDKGDERIKDSIMANAATKVIYRCGADDAQYLEKIFAPQLSASDLVNPPKFHASIKMLVNGQFLTPFLMQAPNVQKEFAVDKEFYAEIIEQSKQLYGRPRAEIDQEIKDRSKLLF